jgi:superfamily II DNA helicase RecQ
MQWGTEVFRPKYRELYQLGAICTEASFTVVTATASVSTRREVCRTLAMTDVSVVTMNPDRGNIKYVCTRRPSFCGADNTAEYSYAKTFESFVLKLKEDGRACVWLWTRTSLSTFDGQQ